MAVDAKQPTPEPRSKAQQSARKPRALVRRDPGAKQDAGKYLGEKLLPIEQIVIQKNVRHNEDAINLIAASFRAEGGETDGQIHPIGVRQIGSDPERYAVIHGHQRLSAAKKEKWTQVKASVWDLGDRDPAFKQLAENQKRSQISMVEEGEVFKRLISKVGMTQVEIAREYGCRPEHISRCLRLVEASDKRVQKLVRDGKLSGHKALAITQLPKEEQGKVAQSATSQDWSLAKIEREIKQIKLGTQSLRQTTTEQPTELIVPVPVEMEHAVLPDDLSATEILRLAVWIILRNGNDQAVLEYLEDRHIPWDDLWIYVRDQNAKELTATMKTLVRRYVEAPHRYASIEDNLKASLGIESSMISYPPEAEQPIALPVEPQTSVLSPRPISTAVDAESDPEDEQ